MIILDTQHVSQLQRSGSADSARLRERLIRSGLPWRITVVTAFEQFEGCLATVRRSSAPEEQSRSLKFLAAMLDHYSENWHGCILGFDADAITTFAGFTINLIRRIGRRDGQIASIALAHGALLLSANLADFRQVPGLLVEDWLR